MTCSMTGIHFLNVLKAALIRPCRNSGCLVLPDLRMLLGEFKCTLSSGTYLNGKGAVKQHEMRDRTVLQKDCFKKITSKGLIKTTHDRMAFKILVD